MKRFLFSLVLVAATAVSFAQDTVLPHDETFRQGVLPNGLTYYLRHNEYPVHQAEFYIAQKVGSIQEDEPQRGLAHFLEHMCFNGTKHFPDDNLLRWCESIGVKFGENLNAYTSIDETVYNISGVPTTRSSALDSCLLILHDWSCDLLLDTAEIDKERGVIHEEWRMRSSAMMRIMERQLPNLFAGSKYGLRFPIGLMSVIDNFKYQALRDYYHKWYRPDNQAIIVVGDINVDEMEQKIRNLFGPIQMPKNPTQWQAETVPDNEAPIIIIDKDKELTSSSISMYLKHEPFPLNKKNTAEYYRQSLISAAVSSMINERLGDMRKKASTPFVGASVGDGQFILAKTKEALSLSATAKENKTIESLQAVLREVLRAAKYGFNASEFERFISDLKSTNEAIYENRNKLQNGTFVNKCVRNFLDQEPILSAQQDYDLYNQLIPTLTIEQANEQLREWLKLDRNVVITCFQPDKEGILDVTEAQIAAGIQAVLAEDLTAYKDETPVGPLVPNLPAPGKIVKEKKIKKLDAKELTLSNGVKVLIKKTDFEENIVTLRANSKGGYSLYEDDDILNLYAMGGVIGATGWGNFKQEQLSKVLAGKNAAVSTGVGNLTENASGSCTPKDMRTMFELLYLHFTAPLRDDEAVESTLANWKNQLRNVDANPMTALSDSIRTTVYGKTKRLIRMREEMIDKISYDRILQIYKERFANAADFTFYIIGNYNEDSLRQCLKQYVATLPASKQREQVVDRHVDVRQGRITNRFERKMQTPQCVAIQLWNGTCPYKPLNATKADFVGEALTMAYLEEIREKAGAAYSVSSDGSLSWNEVKGEGQFSLSNQCPVKPEFCDTVVVMMENILRDMGQNGVPQKYIDKIREYKLKAHKQNQRNNGYWLGHMENIVEFPKINFLDYPERVNSITSENLKDFINDYILKQNNCINVMMLPQQ